MNPYDPPRKELTEPAVAERPRRLSPLLVAGVFGVTGTLLAYPLIDAYLGFQDACSPEPVEVDSVERLVWIAGAALSSASGPALVFRVQPASARSGGGRLGLALVGTWLAVVGTFALGHAGSALLDGEGAGALGLLLVGAVQGGIVGVVGCLAGLAPWILLEIVLGLSGAGEP